VHDVVRVGCGFVSCWIVAFVLTDSFYNTFSRSESINIEVPTSKCNVTCSKLLDKL